MIQQLPPRHFHLHSGSAYRCDDEAEALVYLQLLQCNHVDA